MDLYQQCPDIIYKVAVIGDTHTGKSCLLNRYINSSFNDVFCSTIGVDFYVKQLNIGNKNVKIQLWDTAGQEQYGNLVRSYFTNCTCALIIYDITNRNSFKKIEYWKDTFEMNFSEYRPMVLVGCKSDLIHLREISRNEGATKAYELNMGFIECSAKQNINIDDIFETLSEKIVEMVNDGYKPTPLNGLKLFNTIMPMYLDEKPQDRCCVIC